MCRKERQRQEKSREDKEKGEGEKEELEGAEAACSTHVKKGTEEDKRKRGAGTSPPSRGGGPDGSCCLCSIQDGDHAGLLLRGGAPSRPQLGCLALVHLTQELAELGPPKAVDQELCDAPPGVFGRLQGGGDLRRANLKWIW